MNCTKSKYLIKCEIPGCKNVATMLYCAGIENGAKGIAICNYCIKGLSQLNKTKKQTSEEK